MIPHNIGRYAIVAELGRGGMATVYHAHDPEIGRDVAVKVLPRELLHDPSFRARFRREAQLVATLEHPAIVPIYDVGEDDGQPYIVMRLMRGGSLADRLRNGALPLVETARILSALAPALDRAHTRGILHRDLKSSNILFDEDEQPFIADFGIARFIEETTRLTGGMVGTPAYMSPEQASGETSLDARSDLYSLGVIVFQMLTGQLPYQADTPIGLAMKHVNAPVPRARDVTPTLPPSVDAVIKRALAKSPTARYPTARRLADEVATLPYGGPRPRSPIPRPRPSLEFLTRFGGLAGATLVVILLGGTAALVVLGLLARDILSSVTASPTGQPRATSPSATAVLTPLPATAHATATTSPAASPTHSQTPTPESSPTPEGPPSIGLENVGQLGVVARLDQGDGVQSLAFSVDGRVLAAGSNDGTIRLWDIASGEPLRDLEAHLDVVRHLAFSPDGYTLASASYDNTVRLWDFETGGELHVLEGHTNQVRSVSFSADGRLLASAGGDTIVMLWDVASGELQSTLEGVHESDVVRATFSPDGKRFASGGYDNTVWLWDPVSWQPQGQLEGDTTLIRYLTFSPDSQILAAGTNVGKVHLWNAVSGEPLRVLEGHTDSVISIAFSPDGRTLVTAGDDSTLQLWDAETWAQLRVISEHNQRVFAVAFSPDGRTITSAGDDALIRLWQVRVP